MKYKWTKEDPEPSIEISNFKLLRKSDDYKIEFPERNKSIVLSVLPSSDSKRYVLSEFPIKDDMAPVEEIPILIYCPKDGALSVRNEFKLLKYAHIMRNAEGLDEETNYNVNFMISKLEERVIVESMSTIPEIRKRFLGIL